jgi:hypothetical protein
MHAWLHALVKHAHDLDQLVARAVEDHMHRILHAACPRRVPDVQAAQARQQLGALARRGTFRITRDRSHRRCKQSCISRPPDLTPPIEAGRQNVLEVAARRNGDTKTGHRLARALWPRPHRTRRVEFGEVTLELALVDLGSVTTFESRHAELDLRPQKLEL